MPFNRPPKNEPQQPTPTSARTGGQISLFRALRSRRYWRKLFGCAGGWFLFDITFYGNTLFSPTVLKTVFHQGSGLTPTIGSSIESNQCWQLAILALIGLPGYYMATCFMEKLGRKNIQVMGFAAMAVVYALLGIFLDQLQKSAGLLLFVYGLTYFFSNFGPNSTTFILPSESFPEEVRTTLNGFCAACGKTGAAIGASLINPIVSAAGVNVAFYVCASCSVVGLLVSVLCVDDNRGRNMEEIGQSLAFSTTSLRDKPINLQKPSNA